MVQVLCDVTWRERTTQKIECPRRLGWIAACVDGGERDSEEQTSPILVIQERHKMTVGDVGSKEGTEFPWDRQESSKFIDQLGHNRVTLGLRQ